MLAARSLVDEGSSLFNQVMRNVPVLSPKLQAWVEPSVREQSLRSMDGELPDETDEVEAEGLHQPDEDQEAEDRPQWQRRLPPAQS